MTIVALVIGLLVGGGAVLILLRPALRDGRRDAAGRAEAERRLAEATVRLEAAEGAADERLAAAVRAASAEAFRASSGHFLDLAGARLETTVAPLRESLQRVGRQVEDLDRAREQSYGALREQVTLLSERTGTLANALRSPNVRGRWGEAQLRNVVERAGMLEHCDFVTQASTRGADGDLLRPDLVVRVPGGKSVVVDAKVPLAAYLEAFETRDEAARRDALAAHARQVRDHMAKLAAKAYWRQFSPAPDFVVMFVPDETLLRTAHEHDPTLSEDAWAQSVILASPSTLMSLLRTVAAVWQQETVAQSARAVHDLGAELTQRLDTFGDHLGKVGRALDTAVGSYNKAVGSLESRVLVTARKLSDHGITAGLETPAQVESRPRTPAGGDDDAPVVELPRGGAHAA